MKTSESINHKYAHGPVSLYDIYLEGYQDCKKDNEDNFRREAAKDILCAIVSHTGGNANIERAVELADELIRQLKETEHD